MATGDQRPKTGRFHESRSVRRVLNPDLEIGPGFGRLYLERQDYLAVRFRPYARDCRV